MPKLDVKNVKIKFIPKAVCLSQKIKFSKQVDRETGELAYREFQATCYVVRGITSHYPPKACITLKLGNDKLFLMADEFSELEAAADLLGQFIAKNKVTLNRTLASEARAFAEKDRAVERVKSDLRIQ